MDNEISQQDKMNEKKETESEVEIEEVKSRAIVKYSVPKPAQFVKLQCNTDLNLPPANWLSSSADSYGLQRVTPTQKGFSSFRMAQMYPDCVGDVDVVSDAENIKKLLKLPYTKEQISMMVHRIENSLLIDNFDIYKHFSRVQDPDSDFIWLQQFVTEHVGHKSFQEDRHLYVKHRTREALKQKSLVSKFLYHSLVVNKNELMLDNDVHQSPRSVECPLLPNPSPDVEAPDSESLDNKYNRNVVWTFEDIEMLLGTDMPIFGGGTYPCISLRLRDMTTPINILTGIDYWLDNLMSNVPEVVMCYHLNGIVQKYELIKTEDIPRLDNSKFSPKVIRDVAQNILSFLKTNATKAGHTYWLFKGKDEEIIKLYDLTCLVPQDEKLQNPFTIPVAMLLYRLARSFMKSNEKRPPGTIKMLLKNCLKLLAEEKYPEIVTSSHFMLAEVYVPVSTNPEAPVFESEKGDTDSIYEDDEDASLDEDPESAIKHLDLEAIKSERFVKHYKPPPPITGTVEERCLQAIQHISKGLNCLKYFSQEAKIASQEDEMPMAKPFEPIPMGYSKLVSGKADKEEKVDNSRKCSRKNKDKKKKNEKVLDIMEMGTKENALLVKNNHDAQPLPTWKEKNIKKDGISWKDHLKILLYEKALLVYATLSEHYYIIGNYGSSLRSICLLARCSLVMNKLRAVNQLRENCLLGRAGDCCVMLVQKWKWESWEAHRRQLHDYGIENLMMMEQLAMDERFYGINIGDHNLKCVFIYDFLSVEQMLTTALECYDEALKVAETENMLRRLGNCLNETGMYYLNSAKQLKESKDCIDFAKKAESYLFRGLEIFERIRDKGNIALLHANIGHMHRVLAHNCAPKEEERGELTDKEKFHYNKSLMLYGKAMKILGDRECAPGIWDTVIWELSTSLFNMATLMHEHPPAAVSLAEAEKEVLEALQKALQSCDFNEENPKFPLYQYRAALIHYRMASLHHKHLLSIEEKAAVRKRIISLARSNYEMAAKYYFASQDVINYFTAQMQKFGLIESLAEDVANPSGKIKHLQSCLEIVLEMQEMVELLVDSKVKVPEEGEANNCDCVNENGEKGANCENCENGEMRTYNTIHSLLNLVKQRLQYILKALLKLCSSHKTYQGLAEIYRECYKATFILKDDSLQHELLVNSNIVLKQIKQLISNK